MTWLDDVTNHLGHPTNMPANNDTCRGWTWTSGGSAAVIISRGDHIGGRYSTRVYGPDGTITMTGSREPSDAQMRVLCTAAGILPMPAKED